MLILLYFLSKAYHSEKSWSKLARELRVELSDTSENLEL